MRILYSAVLLGLFVQPVTAQVAPRDVDSRVSAVTVYADRARVTRVAEIKLSGAPRVFRLEGLPGWIDEGSVRVALEPTDAGQILGVEIRRTFLARPSDEEFRAAEDAVLEVRDQLTALDDEKAVLETAAQHVENLRVFSAERLPQDSATRRVEASEYREALDFVTESLRQIAEARRQIVAQRRDLEPELRVREQRLAELRQRAQLEQRSLLISAAGKGAVSLAATYMIPGATWEPAHEVRADGGAAAVTLSSFALVRQTTGEDWQEAEITLSTQRSDQTLRIPEIEALHLGSGRSLSRWVAGSQESFGAATENYARSNQAYFAAKNSDRAFQQAYAQNQSLQLDNARRVAALFSSLEQRGTTAHFSVVGPQTVASDGSRARLPIGSARLDASQRILAAPELSLNAIRTLDLSNPGDLPLLPGRVSLYVDAAFLGFTETEFIAPGEAFELFLGVADHIKLSRALDRRNSALSRRGTRTKLSVAFVIRVENLADRDETIELRDRVPVSETDQIRVTDVRVAPEGQPNDAGLLAWRVALAPHEAREFRIGYTVEYPTGLPLATESDDAEVGGERDLRDQLLRLEKSLQ